MEFIAKDGKKFDNLADAEKHEAELIAQEQQKIADSEELVKKITSYLAENLQMSCVSFLDEEGDEPRCEYFGCADSSYDSKGAQLYVQALIETYEGARYDFGENNHPVMLYNISNYSGAVIKKMACGLALKFVEGGFKELDELVYQCEEEDVEYCIHIGDDLKELLGVADVAENSTSENCDRICRVHIMPISARGDLSTIMNMLMNM